MDNISSITKLYDERKDFIIIGLTGRTGSGCSTVAEILSTKCFSSLNLREPRKHEYSDIEERKFSILYEYGKSENNWRPFRKINMSTIITWFLIEENYDSLINYIRTLKISGNADFDIEELTKSLSTIEDEYNSVNDYLETLNSNEHDLQSNELAGEIMSFYESLESITIKLKKSIQGVNCVVLNEMNDKITYSHFYTYFYQKIGNNIRSSGNPFSDEYIPEALYTLAERCNYLIKMIRANDLMSDDKKGTLLCIDAIRNPYEAVFFKDRYSAFYLISVNTEDEIRRSRLSFLRKEEIDSLDEREYPTKLKSFEKFYHQDIGSCLGIADIHLYNPDITDGKYYYLTRQVLKYIMLIIHPGIVTPTHIERCMQVAYNAKLNSGCLSRQVGAVVTNNEYSIISIGWNEVPKGQISCGLRDIEDYCKNKDKDTFSNFEITNEEFSEKIHTLNDRIKKYDLKGRKHPYCFRDIYNEIKGKDNQVYTRALHAEENAFLAVSKYGGLGVKNGYLFTTASPCELCAKKAYHLGIKTIYYIDPYPGISRNHILMFGEDNPEMKLFYGAIGAAYISLYTPKMPYKDELKLLIDNQLKEYQ